MSLSLNMCGVGRWKQDRERGGRRSEREKHVLTVAQWSFAALSLSLSHAVSLLHTLSVCVIMGGMHTVAIFGAGGIWKLCFPARAWYYYTKMKSKAESHANAHTVRAKDTHIHTQFRQKLECKLSCS